MNIISLQSEGVQGTLLVFTTFNWRDDKGFIIIQVETVIAHYCLLAIADLIDEHGIMKLSLVFKHRFGLFFPHLFSEASFTTRAVFPPTIPELYLCVSGQMLPNQSRSSLGYHATSVLLQHNLWHQITITKTSVSLMFPAFHEEG